MDSLSHKQRAFLDEMNRDPAFEDWGFEKLATRDDRLKYFRSLVDMGMFAPSRAPSPEKTNDGFRIPYWRALVYLEMVAKDVSACNDIEAAQLLMRIIRSISTYKDENEKPIDNYHTWHSFAIIISSLPREVISVDDISMLGAWLDSSFNSSLVGGEVGKAFLPKLLESGDSSDHLKATKVIEYVTQLKTIGTKIVTAVESYWLNKLFEKNREQLGYKCGQGVLNVLRKRIEELIELKGIDLSYIHLPAIEDHEQNKYRKGALPDLIVAYRDIMSVLIQCKEENAREVLRELIQSIHPTLKRIAYHFINEHFEMFNDAFWDYFGPDIFVNEVHHELFTLLKNHFSKFTDSEKIKVFEAIRDMPSKQYKTDIAEEAERYHKMDQHHWLLSIKGLGSQETDEFYEALTTELGFKGDRGHPEFLTYSESSWGPGPAKFGINELLDFIRRDPDILVEKLNSFEEPGTWKGPTIRAQSDALTEAIKKEPNRFIGALPTLLRFTRPYQYAVIDGLKSLWDGGADIDWPATLKYCWSIINEEKFWADIEEDKDKEYTGYPSSGWIVSSIADLLRSGVSNDNRAMNPELMIEVKQITEKLLNNIEASAVGSESDAMTEAINTQKGHCLELLFSYALRNARLEDKENQSHVKAWEDVQLIFESELSLCVDANFEFSTLAGCYLPQIHYLNREWLQENLRRIFPNSFGKNFLCAIQGLAYINAFYHDIYLLLKESGIWKRALDAQVESHYAREKILQYIGVAYLNDDEALHDAESLISNVLESFNEKDVSELISFFWMQRDSGLDTSKQDKVILFWQKCSEKISGYEDSYKRLLSKLSLLTVFVAKLTEKTRPLVAQAAPYVGEDFNTSWFLEYITKIAQKSPDATGRILRDSLENWGPVLDDRELRKCLEQLRDAGEVDQVRVICNMGNIRSLRWASELYQSL